MRASLRGCRLVRRLIRLRLLRLHRIIGVHDITTRKVSTTSLLVAFLVVTSYCITRPARGAFLVRTTNRRRDSGGGGVNYWRRDRRERRPYVTQCVIVMRAVEDVDTSSLWAPTAASCFAVRRWRKSRASHSSLRRRTTATAEQEESLSASPFMRVVVNGEESSSVLRRSFVLGTPSHKT